MLKTVGLLALAFETTQSGCATAVSTTCGESVCFASGAAVDAKWEDPTSWTTGEVPRWSQTAELSHGKVTTVSQPLKLSGLKVSGGTSIKIGSSAKLVIDAGCAAQATCLNNVCKSNAVCQNEDLCQCGTGFLEFMYPLDPLNRDCSHADTTANPTPVPTAVPTAVPTPVPTAVPTPVPTAVPTPVPTAVPTTPQPTPVGATNSPTALPTEAPTAVPTASPTLAPTASPTVYVPPPTASPTVYVPPTNEPTSPPAATVYVEIGVSKTPSTQAEYDNWAKYLGSLFKQASLITAHPNDDLNGDTFAPCIVSLDENGAVLQGITGRGAIYKFGVIGECNLNGKTARDYSKAVLTAMSTTRFKTETGETAAKLIGAIECTDAAQTVVVEGEECPVDEPPTAAASLPIVPIAAGAGGFILLVVIFLVVRAKGKKKGGSAGKYTKAQVLDSAAPVRRQPSRAGPRTARGSRTTRGSTTGRGAPPAPPGRAAVEMPKPSMFPPLAANKPLISKKKTGRTGRGLDEA